ncbi:hypothetical protein EYF80_055994 [Liparis tanakae]|uniref:Uncharacterized protein n=1 Tax=Liparis tanakae TaxID=230148 RepID=A0A4Z2EY08_9TELE|nr:hypothetical protein EYF80_055994 [Liparis tanakae]
MEDFTSVKEPQRLLERRPARFNTSDTKTKPVGAANFWVRFVVSSSGTSVSKHSPAVKASRALESKNRRPAVTLRGIHLMKEEEQTDI